MLSWHFSYLQYKASQCMCHGLKTKEVINILSLSLSVSHVCAYGHSTLEHAQLHE